MLVQVAPSSRSRSARIPPDEPLHRVPILCFRLLVRWQCRAAGDDVPTHRHSLIHREQITGEVIRLELRRRLERAPPVPRRVIPGRPYIRSKLAFRIPPARIVRKASRASSAACRRPSIASVGSSKLWTPRLIRLTPADVFLDKLHGEIARIRLQGDLSIVGQHRSIHDRHRESILPAAPVSRLGVPPPKIRCARYVACPPDVGDQCIYIARNSLEAVCLPIEIAIRADRLAERDVDVDADGARVSHELGGMIRARGRLLTGGAGSVALALGRCEIHLRVRRPATYR